MQKIREHLSKFWIVYLVGLILLTIFIRTIVPKTPQKRQISESGSIFELQPGFILSEEELGKLQIVKQKPLGTNTILETKSGFDSKNNEIIIDEKNKVIFVKEHVVYDANHTLQQYISKIGKPDLVLETPTISDAIQAHVFLEEGLVIIAHKLDNTVQQRWSFEPTIEQAFLASWGKEMKPDGSPSSQDPLPN